MLILSCWHLYAMDRASTLQIYHKLLTSLAGKNLVSVYVADKAYLEVFATSSRIRLVPGMSQADVVLITSQKVLLESLSLYASHASRPVLFATDYRYLKKSENIVGAFYWRKGRTQLLFMRQRLKHQHISLPSIYAKYIVNNL